MKINKYLILILILIIPFSSIKGQVDFDVNNSDEIKSLNSEINTKKDLIKKKQDQQEALKKALAEKQAEKISLTNQLSILDNRLEKAKIDIESAQIEIDTKNLEIEKNNLSIEEKNEEIINEKNNISETLNLMYKKDGVNSLEIILLNKSLSDFLSQIKYLENINSELKNSLTKVYKLKELLEENNLDLEKQKTSLEILRKDLENKKALLASEQEDKAFVLDQTRSSEQEYQRLIKLAKQEQEQASSEIYNLEKKMRDRIAELSKNKEELINTGFAWPVKKNTITAYFHDPEYPFKQVFEHPGIDIRASQGSTLRAAADGYVARAKDAGKGYSYIMIVHGDGLSTVYGHVSRISVIEDQFVKQGQVIGATGGLPGTPGAGNLTTGAHLHFEVRNNGIPVNPLEYLP